MKVRSLLLLVLAQVGAMSAWFSSSAILPALVEEFELTTFQQANLSSAVQLGFVFGALISAIINLPDRFDPRLVLALSAMLTALSNLSLLAVDARTLTAVLGRFGVGFALAGVYPVGMKIAAGWGQKDRGLLMGILVGSVTLGSASPHLISGWGSSNWRWVIVLTSVCGFVSSACMLLCKLGPYHARSPQFRPRLALMAWTHPLLRAANLGYLGHMWELYGFWAWIPTALAASVAASGRDIPLAGSAFAIIGVGAVSSVLAGLFADRLGKVQAASLAMVGSGASAIMAAGVFYFPEGLMVVSLVWGFFVVADSAQFSARIADVAPKDAVGTLLTIQTCQGYLLTVFVVQMVPWFAEQAGWPATFVGLALGPILGVLAFWPSRLGTASAASA